MTRSLLTYTATAQIQGIEHVLVGATIHVYEQGTSTPVAATLWDSPTAGSGQANPLTTPANGTITFWLDTAQYVDLVISKAGFSTLRETIAVGDPVGGIGGTDPVDAAAGTPSLRTLGTGAQQAAAGSHSHSLDGLSDVAVSAASTSQTLIYNGTNFVNGRHVFNVKAYGAVGDGTTDDSTAINAASLAASNNAYGTVYFPDGAVYACKNVNMYSRVHYELAGSTLQFHTSGTNSDDIIRTATFNTDTGTTHSVVDGAQYGFELRNGLIIGPTSNTGRHSIAIYGSSYRVSNLFIIHRGLGSALWTEYAGVADWNVSGSAYYPTGKSCLFEDIGILDAITTAGVTTLPTGNNMSLTVAGATIAGGVTLTVTTSNMHYLVTGMTATLASIGGITGAAGSFTVTVTGATTFTVTGTFTGTYTSGGTVSYAVSASWFHSGPTDCQGQNLYLFATTHVRGRRGLMVGTNAGGDSGTGFDIANIHVHLNWSVAVDLLSNATLTNCQLEGSYKAVLIVRTNGRSNINGRIYGGQGGVTLISLRNSNHNILRVMVHQCGSGAAAPSGFTNTIWENSGAGNLLMEMMGQHDYTTAVKCSAGTAPGNSYVRAFVSSFNTGVVSSDFGTNVDTTHWGYHAAPTGITLVNA